MSEIIVKSLHIYPIKSLGGISLDRCQALIEGLEHDRRWMLVDESGQFQTQRENAQLALFSCSLNEDSLSVQYQNERIEVPFKTSEQIKKVQVWDSKLKAQEVDPDISAWFSKHLNIKVHLVKMTHISNRNKRFLKPPYKTQVSFADGYPYLILGEGSMNHLNAQLDTPLEIDRFRANIIVSSAEPHIEDSWNQISIGDSEMMVIKPCARCIVTTIDQQTADKGPEPLKTLSGYRKKENKIYFGANAIFLKGGPIKVGDTVKINQ